MREIVLPYDPLTTNTYQHVLEGFANHKARLPFSNTPEYVRLYEATKFAIKANIKTMEIAMEKHDGSLAALDEAIRKICCSRGLEPSVVEQSAQVDLLLLHSTLKLPEHSYLEAIMDDFNAGFESGVASIKSYKAAAEYHAGLLKCNDEQERCITAKIRTPKNPLPKI